MYKAFQVFKTIIPVLFVVLLCTACSSMKADNFDKILETSLTKFNQNPDNDGTIEEVVSKENMIITISNVFGPFTYSNALEFTNVILGTNDAILDGNIISFNVTSENRELAIKNISDYLSNLNSTTSGYMLSEDCKYLLMDTNNKDSFDTLLKQIYAINLYNALSGIEEHGIIVANSENSQVALGFYKNNIIFIVGDEQFILEPF